MSTQATETHEYIGSKFFNNELEFWRERIRQHGVYTVEFLEQVKGLPFWAPVFGLTPENLEGKILLEYGPAICPAVAGRDYKCTKLAVEPLMTRLEEYGYNFGRFTDVVFIQGTAEDVPVASNSVDAILHINMLNHLERVEKVMAETFRVLRPGGHVYGAVPIEQQDDIYHPVAFNWESLHKLHVDAGLRVNWSKEWEFPYTPPHNHPAILIDAYKPL
jgi:SAM-dependent methyltransferase